MIGGSFDSLKNKPEAEAPEETVTPEPKKIFTPPEKGKRKLTSYQKHVFKRLWSEHEKRITEASKLYEPIPKALEFHRSQARERILRGSNRASKTLTACMEVAWIVSRRHPYREFPKEGRMIIVGKSEGHLASVVWDKLTRPQAAFRRIKDAHTGQWRNYRPWQDKERWVESQPHTPLIPPRLIKGKPAWKKANPPTPEYVRLTTGWEIRFYAGGGIPPAGMDVDVVWFDEEIINELWYTEMAARLLDRKGNFIWSATAQEGGEHLWNLHLASVKEASKEKPRVEEFHMTLDDNPYIEEEEKQLLAAKYEHDPDQYRVRILGEFLSTSYRMYPMFAKSRHCIAPFPIPENWCRYAIVDPGATVSAVLFVAVPPPDDEDWGGHVIAYDELYIRDCDPDKWGKAMKHKCDGVSFEAFIIDDRGSRRTEGGSGTTMRALYSEELERHRIRSRRTDSSFILGNANRHAGYDTVRKWLSIWEDSKNGHPHFLIMHDGGSQCHNLVYEIERYHKKRVRGRPTEDPSPGNDHLCDCVRYAAMQGCEYVDPLKKRRSWVMEKILARKQKQNEGPTRLAPSA